MLEKNYDQTNVRDFINLLLTVIALPNYINDKKFLLDVSKHQLQAIYETDEIEHALKATNDLFSDFVNKYQIWKSLEQQHDIRQDQAAAQQKAKEIYTSLKQVFEAEPDEKKEQLKTFMDKLEGKEVPEHIMKVIDEELKRFSQLDKMHSEYQTIKTYLDYLTGLPFGVRSEENYDIKQAKEKLDEGHYGMDDVK